MFWLAASTAISTEEGEQNALEMFFAMTAVTIMLGAVLAGYLMYRMVKFYGKKEQFIANLTSFLTFWVNGAVLFFAMGTTMMFGETLMSELAGWSILIGLCLLECVAILRILAIWEMRTN